LNWPNSVFLTIKDATHVTLQTSECSVATALSFLENPVLPVRAVRDARRWLGARRLLGLEDRRPALVRRPA
jgi:hypothetical protein